MEKIFLCIVQTIKAGEPEVLQLPDIKPEDASDLIARLRNPSNHLESYRHRIHYSSLTRGFKIVMPTRLHECIASWMLKCCCQWAVAGLLPPQWHSTVDMMNAPEHDNFIGEFTGSFKEPDFCFVPSRKGQHLEFPSIVIESGWWESGEQLKKDKDTWLVGSGAQVRVVLQAKFSRPNIQNKIGLTVAIWRADPRGSTISQVIKVLPPPAVAAANPTFTIDELYAGSPPSGIDGHATLPLDLACLRLTAERFIIDRGCLPAA